MTEKEIYSKIEGIYNSDKGKGFITHLLRNYFPANKAQFSWSTPKKKRMVCCITGTKLCSKDDLMAAHLDIGPTEFAEYMKKALDPEAGHVEHPMMKKIGKKVLAVESKDSDKLLCQQAWQQLYNFYASELLKGNKHMHWLGKSIIKEAGIGIMKKETESRWQKLGLAETPEEEKALREKINKPAKQVLGDIDSLHGIRRSSR